MIVEKDIFKDRVDAASHLLKILPIENMKLENWIIVATSMGGLVIADEIASKIDAKIDYIFTHKILAPLNSECEIAIITEKEEVVIHEELVKSFDIDLESIFVQAKEEYEKYLIPQMDEYKGKALCDLANQNVLLLDEGLNTGLTMMACIKTIINMKAKSVAVATPIMPTAIKADLEAISDDLYCYKSIDHFVSIDFYYKELNPIFIEDIKKYLKGKQCQ
ncbi:MAG: ABC transporter [Arcobacteraceae bacterium]|nr:ABC transporter [Arcobacteraceae bacterium]